MKYNSLFGIDSAKPIEIRPIDTLRFHELPDGSIKYVSDATLLLNQERIINELGEETWQNLVRNMGAPSKLYKSGQFSDSELLRYQKSRYIQSPAELSAWLDSLKVQGETILQDAKDKHEALVQEQIAKEAAERQVSQVESKASE